MDEKVIELNAEADVGAIMMASKIIDPNLAQLKMGDRTFIDALQESEEKILLSYNNNSAGCGTGTVFDEKTNSCIVDRKSTRLNSSHSQQSRMPSSA